jgi:hypothetical protein
MKSPKQLPSASSTPSDVDEAKENLVQCLEGLDQRGAAGLQEALDRIYPRSGFQRVPLGPRFPNSHALVMEDSNLKTVPYSPEMPKDNPA